MSSPDDTASMLGKIASYTEILHRDPRSTVFVSLAEAYRQMGLLEDALEVARRGVAALPRFCPGYTVLGRILAQQNQVTEAKKAFSAALAIDPDSISALKGLARVYGRLKWRDEARKVLEKAAQVDPEDEWVARMLASLGPAETKATRETPENAVDASNPAADDQQAAAGDEGDSPIATATIAEIYVKQGLFSKALQVYQGLLKANPGNEQVRERCRELEGQISAAAQGTAPLGQDANQEGTGMDVPEKTQMLAVELLNRWLDAIRDRRARHVR